MRSILLPGKWDTVFNIVYFQGYLVICGQDTCLFTSRDMGYLVPPYTIEPQQCLPANTCMRARDLPNEPPHVISNNVAF